VFTGIVEEMGTVVSRDGARLRINCSEVLSDVVMGASIAVNGCCLTVVEWGDDWFDTELTEETWTRTGFAALALGDPVNLERPVRLADRLGGHLVQGHVDGVGTVVSRDPSEHWEVVRIALPPALARYVVEKGSIAVDGVSLTVSAVGAADLPEPWFEVSLIPTTLRETTLGARTPGDPVNLEVDVIAKYVERLTGAGR
jgi:riboflavin synthase